MAAALQGSSANLAANRSVANIVDGAAGAAAVAAAPGAPPAGPGAAAAAAATAAQTADKKKAGASTNFVEKKRGTLDVRHRYLLERFAALVDEKPAALENSLLHGNKLDLVNAFFAEDGPRRILFCWQSQNK
ncbi:MAG: hypothetical protein BJ554DRAFT_691, partial [Olpidium bornovanus]